VGDHAKGSEHNCEVLGRAKPECTVRLGRKTLAKPERFGAQVRGTAIPFGARKTPEVLAG